MYRVLRSCILKQLLRNKIQSILFDIPEKIFFFLHKNVICTVEWLYKINAKRYTNLCEHFSDIRKSIMFYIISLYTVKKYNYSNTIWLIHVLCVHHIRGTLHSFFNWCLMIKETVKNTNMQIKFSYYYTKQIIYSPAIILLLHISTFGIKSTHYNWVIVKNLKHQQPALLPDI